MQAEILGRPELDWSSESVLQLQLHLSQMQQAGCVSGMELDQEVDVAVRAEVVAEGGAEQCEASDAVAAGEHGEEGLVEGQTRSQSHAVIMPHQGAAVAYLFDPPHGSVWAAHAWTRRTCRPRGRRSVALGRR